MRAIIFSLGAFLKRALTSYEEVGVRFTAAEAERLSKIKAGK